MKKIIFVFGIMMALFQPTYSFAVKALPAHNSEFVKHGSLSLSNFVLSENSYSDNYIFDIVDDDKNDSETNRFSSGKTAFTLTLFLTNDFFEKFFKNRWSSRHIFQLPASHFISLNVFRL